MMDERVPVRGSALHSTEARVLEILRLHSRLVYISIIRSEGSAPRHAGTHAILSDLGFEGTVGGGILEARTIALAQDALRSGTSMRALFRLDASAESDMVCGGVMDVLCEMVDASSSETFRKAIQVEEEGKAGYWKVDILDESQGEGKKSARRVTVRRSFCVNEEGCEETSKCCVMNIPQGERYFEPRKPLPVLLLCGGGHVGLEVGRLASECDFVVDVVDDREEFANPSRFPFARNCFVSPSYASIDKMCGIGKGHYIAIMTRGHAFDYEVLSQVLPSSAKYIGMIGSRTKRDTIYARLLQQGVSAKLLERVCCPIGLSFKTETPEQIAVAVVAELLAAKANVLEEFRPMHSL